MNKKNLLLWGVFGLLIMLSACENDEPSGENTEQEKINEKYDYTIDKQDSVLLDGGKYVAATTEFTDAEAEKVLQGAVWKNRAYPAYVYDSSGRIKRISGYCDTYMMKFYDKGLFKSVMVGMGFDITTAFDTNQKFEYYVKDKILFMRYVYYDKLGNIYSDTKTKVKLVAVDSTRIIFDNNGIGVDLPSIFPADFDKSSAKTRRVWTAYEEE